MENPVNKWRFLAGKIIYQCAIFHKSMDLPSSKLTWTLAENGVGRLVSTINWSCSGSMLIYQRVIYIYIYATIPTWWLIPLSKWVITPVVSGLTLLIPFITGVITHLLSGMSHQVGLPVIFVQHPSTLASKAKLFVYLNVHPGFWCSGPHT